MGMKTPPMEYDVAIPGAVSKSNCEVGEVANIPGTVSTMKPVPESVTGVAPNTLLGGKTGPGDSGAPGNPAGGGSGYPG